MSDIMRKIQWARFMNKPVEIDPQDVERILLSAYAAFEYGRPPVYLAHFWAMQNYDVCPGDTFIVPEEWKD